MVGDVDELEEDVEQSLSCLEGAIDVEEGKLEEELDDKPGLAKFHAASRAPLLSFRLFLRLILKFWSIGVTLMGITWTNHSKRWVLVSNVSMTYRGFSETNTSDWFPYI